jgi:hypothetical protein
MSWSGGTYTRTNGTYSGAQVWESDEANGFDIDSDRHDTHDQDLATGINNCLNKNGQNAMTANLAMGGNKVTGLANGTAATDAVTKSQLDAKVPDGSAFANLLAWNGSAYVSTPFTSYLPNGTSSGDVATWDGSAWTAQASGGGGSLPAGVTTNSGLRWSGSAWVETDTLLLDSSGEWTLGPASISGSVGGTIASTDDDLWIGSDGVTNGLYIRSTISTVTMRAASRSDTGTANNRLALDATDYRVSLSNIERIRINTTGRTEFGGGLGNNQVRLRVQGVSGDTSIFQAVNTAGDEAVIDCRNGVLHSPATFTNTVGGGDAVVMNTSSPGGQFQRVSSSLRYKQDIENIEYGLTEVLAMRPVTFANTGKPEKRFAGLIAEEVETLGLTEFINYDEQGQPDGIQYANMIAMLIKAVQELSAQVEAE